MAEDQSTPAVEYRLIPGFPGYRVGSDASVWSCRVMGSHNKDVIGPWRLMRPVINRRGYFELRVGPRRRQVHRLVLKAFVGPCPAGMEACHNDGNKLNNSPENLRWDTPESNRADMRKHGAYACGERNAAAKLTRDEVLRIRDLRKAGVPVREIRKLFQISENAVYRIERGEAWSHL